MPSGKAPDSWQDGGAAFEVESVGVKPNSVRPEAIQAMQEIGIDISGHLQSQRMNSSGRASITSSPFAIMRTKRARFFLATRKGFIKILSIRLRMVLEAMMSGSLSFAVCVMRFESG